MNAQHALAALALAALVGCGSNTPNHNAPTASASSSGGDRTAEGAAAVVLHSPADQQWNVWGCRGANCDALNFPNRPLGNEDCVSLVRGEYDSYRIQDAHPRRGRQGICYAPFTGTLTVEGVTFAPEHEDDGECAEVTVLRTTTTAEAAP